MQSDHQLEDSSEHIIAYIPDSVTDQEALLDGVEEENADDSTMETDPRRGTYEDGLDENIESGRSNNNGEHVADGRDASLLDDAGVILTAMTHHSRLLENGDQGTVQEVPQQAMQPLTRAIADEQENTGMFTEASVISELESTEDRTDLTTELSNNTPCSSSMDDAGLMLSEINQDTRLQLDMSESRANDNDDRGTAQEVPQQEHLPAVRTIVLERGEEVAILSDTNNTVSSLEVESVPRRLNEVRPSPDVENDTRRSREIAPVEVVTYGTPNQVVVPIVSTDGRRDQELQVVPDDSADGCKGFVSENLHETSEGVTEVHNQSAASLGVQMVPTVSEGMRTALETDSAPEELQPGLEPTGLQSSSSEVSSQVVSSVLQVGDPGPATFADLLQAIESSGDASVPVSVTSSSSYVFQALRPVSSSPSPSGNTNYQVCVAVSDGQDTNMSVQSDEVISTPVSSVTATSTLTVPVTVGDRIQQIPIELADWADLTQQNLVAVAEDGTTIPLTVIQTGSDVALRESHDSVKVEDDSAEVTEGVDEDLTNQVLQQLAAQNHLSSAGMPQSDHIEVINMHPSEDSLVLEEGQELPEGIIHLVQSLDGATIATSALRGLQLRTGSLPSSVSSGLTPYAVLDGSSITIQEQSILPDSPGEVTNVIHIPEDSYLSGQPIELQVLEVPGGGRLLQHIPSGTVIGGNSVTPSVMIQRRGAAPSRRPTRRPRRGVTEAQRAVRSLGQPRFFRAPRQTTIRGGRGGFPTSRSQRLSGRMRRIDPEEIQDVNDVDIQGYYTIQEDEERNDEEAAIEDAPTSNTSPLEETPRHKIQLSNSTPSVISPENMQALIQILQALPNSSKGQTIQIILQNGSSSSQETATTATTSTGDDQHIHVVRMPSLPTQSSTKKTSDIAIQVSPEFIEDAHLNAIAEMNQPLSENDSTTVKNLADPDVDQEDEDNVITPEADVDNLMAVALGLRPEAGVEQGVRRKRQQKKKPSSKQIVTVEEQWVVDPKPGVSYYAVIDYLSEHEQDGMSSASEMKRPEAPSSGFMEDHLELHSFSEENKGRSLLESTVDSSVVVSPFRRGRYRVTATQTTSNVREDSIDLPVVTNQSSVTLRERTFEQAQLEEQCLSEQPMPEVRRYRRGSRTMRTLTERLEHRCGYCEFESGDKILVVEHCISEHDDRPVKTLSLLPHMGGRTCPYCRQCFDHTEFFSHMRFAHNEVHPYKCGYCDFMGRDRNQIRHHIQKKHRLPMKVINLLDAGRRHDDGDPQGRRRIMALSEGEESVYEYLTDEEETDENDSDAAGGGGRRGLVCPECKKTFKTLKYLKTHIKIHQAHRYQCGYCDFISVMLHQVIRHCQKKHSDVDPKVLTKELEPDKNPIVSRDIDTVVQKVFSLNTRLPRDPDASKWMRKWFCPHCDYTCQFGASYRRHLRMHANVLPFKCNYCSFKGREKYYVRRHIHRMHHQLPMIVVENTPENCAGDTSSDEDFQEKGLRRKRRRRVKSAIHAVVPVDSMSDASFAQHFEKLPVGERGTYRAGRSSKDASTPTAMQSTQEHVIKNRSGGPRLPRTKEWSGENVSDYILERDGDKIVCKMCGQKTLAKAFYKHARKHFKVKPFKCGYCNYMSIERAKIRVHNTLRHPNAPFRIEECHLASITPQDFMDLIGAEASGEPEDGGGGGGAAAGEVVSLVQAPPHFCCPLCQSAVEYEERSLREHFFAHYDYYPFKCSECDFHATSEDKVSEHAAIHPDTQVIVYQLEQDMPEGLEETIQQFLKQGEELIEQHRLAEILTEQTAGGGDSNAVMEDHQKEDVIVGGSSLVAPEKSVSAFFQCPICDRYMNLHAVTVRRHLYSHYNYKPFKCGYCNFQGVSKANIKQHTVTHGSVVPKIEMTDELMPDELTSMLHHIQGVLNLTPETIEGVAPVTDGEMFASSDFQIEEPVTAEGKIWKESLTRGECPVCQANVGASGTSLYEHVLGHFGARSIQCGYCPQTFSEREDANSHIVQTHPNMEIRLTESLENEEIVRKGLLQYLKQKQNDGSATKEMIVTAVPPASSDSNDPVSSSIDVVRPSDSEVNGHKYQMVIISENGTVVDTMEMVSDGNTCDHVEMKDDDARVSLEPSDRNPKADDVTTTGDLTDSSRKDSKEEVVTQREESDITSRQDKITDNVDDDFDADIVTVEGVLLTRAFRSETEASSDDDGASSGFSNHDSVDSSRADDQDADDDDDDDTLPTSPWVDFVNDVMNLLKQSATDTQNKTLVTAASVAKSQGTHQGSQHGEFQCDQCGRRFAKMAGMQVHIHKVHKKEMQELQCSYCNYTNRDRGAIKRHLKSAHPNRPLNISECVPKDIPQNDTQSGIQRQTTKRGFEGDEDGQEDEIPTKMSKLEEEISAPQEVECMEQGEEEEEEEEETVENIAKMLQSTESITERLVTVESGETNGISSDTSKSEKLHQSEEDPVPDELETTTAPVIIEEALDRDQTSTVSGSVAAPNRVSDDQSPKSSSECNGSSLVASNNPEDSVETVIPETSTAPTTIETSRSQNDDNDPSSSMEVTGPKSSPQNVVSSPSSVSAETCESRTQPESLTADCQVEDDVINNCDGTLEGLENLEECDENLPKILQILQLRPTKDADKP